MSQQHIKKFLNELKSLSTSESIPCVGGKSDLPTQLGLEIKNRHISLPVSNKELEWLCKEGTESPFGKGMDTVVDPNVRRSIEFEAHNIKIGNPNWQPALNKLLESVTQDMGIDFNVEAELFKLLVYREGGHFKFHQDTEKSDHMFGTLIMQLPSRCQGGTLNCRFSGEEYHFDFGNKAGDSEFSIYYSAHYADVQHQVEKISSGSRVVLIYNLIQPEKERKLSANHHKNLLESTTDKLLPIFNLLTTGQHAFLLQHEYTQKSLADLGFLATKGEDRDLLKSLIAINNHLPLEKKLHFLISRVSYSVSSYGSEYSNNDIEWYESDTSEPACDLLYDEDGQSVPSNHFHIDWAHDLSNKKIVSTFFEEAGSNFWGNGDDYIEGFMGNYGPTKETTYARYLLVIMPLYPDNDDTASHDMGMQTHIIRLMAEDLQNHPDHEWLKERFNKALQKALTEFDLHFCQEEKLDRWNRDFDQKGKAIFSRLIHTAIEINDQNLCLSLLNKAKARIVASLESSYQYEDILKILMSPLNHFGWDGLSEAYVNLLSELTGSVVLKTAVALVENKYNQAMYTKIMDVCVDIICREKNKWGGECGFMDTILPLAMNLCDSKCSASESTKKLFLETCLHIGSSHPEFLSAITHHLINTDKLDGKGWLLQPLCSLRLNQLEVELDKEIEVFSWGMPNAKSQKKTITVFLRSNDQQAKIAGYDGIAMARRDVINIKRDAIVPELHMESKANFIRTGKNHSFSATMEAKGRGKAAYVEIIKDKRYYDLCIKLRKLRKKEYKKLKDFAGSEIYSS